MNSRLLLPSVVFAIRLQGPEIYLGRPGELLAFRQRKSRSVSDQQIDVGQLYSSHISLLDAIEGEWQGYSFSQ